MAIPSDPTALELIRDGLIVGGQYNVATTSTAVTNFQARQFQTIKTELWEASITDDLLRTVTYVTTTVGSRAILLPTDFDHEETVRVFDGPDGNRGTCQAGYPRAVTLASTFTADSTTILGSYVFPLSGPGSGQVGEIVEYSDTTKIATISSAWGVPPTSATTYLVANYWYTLPKTEVSQGYAMNTRPNRYRLRARTLEIEPPADKIYPIELTYGTNLTRVDETSAVFIRHLRERRAYWIQGIKTYAMGLYDDDRYDTNWQIWQQMLVNYGGKNAVSVQIARNR